MSGAKYFIFHFAFTDKKSPQIKKFPKNWLGPLRQGVHVRLLSCVK